jgi:hypothetical protein
MHRPSLLALVLAACLGIASSASATPPPTPPRAPTAQTELATSLRNKADQMSRTLARSTGRGADPQAAEYVRTRLQSDFSTLTVKLGELQHVGNLDPMTEQRAMAAANRVLVAAARANASLHPGDRDYVESLLSGARYRFLIGHNDTAVETEARMTNGVLAALTTEDGTIGPILREGGRPGPEFLEGLARGRPIASIPLDELSPAQKYQLLKSQSEGRDFFVDRRIPGVIFRNGVGVSGGLQKKVEYLGPASVDKVTGIEYHVREPGPASHTLKDAMIARRELGTEALSRHQHVPAKIPASILKGDDVDRFRLVDFYRRTNVTAELKAILEGRSIRPNINGDIIYFDFLKGDGLADMNTHFSDIATTGHSGLDSEDLKMGAVGFRTGDTYGDPRMFGFEIRSINPKRTEQWGTFANAVQKGVLTGSYGIPRAAAGEWHERHVGSGPRTLDRQNEVLARLHYNRGVDNLLADAHATLRPLLTPQVTHVLDEYGEKNYGVKMLVHDWSDDPALGGDTAAQAQVLAAQQHALRALGAGPVDAQGLKSVIHTFVSDSGLYKAFGRSIGMADPVVAAASRSN